MTSSANAISQLGLFITFEGGEGVGKSTNLQFAARWLANRSIDVVCTREPGGTPVAEEIRGLLLSPRQEIVDPMAELLLVFAARAQHLNAVILPALNRGTWILCDRFTDATFAYQGYGRQIPLAAISQLEKLVQGEVFPDCTFLLDADSDIGLTRAKNRGGLDRFEQEDIDFYRRVREGYLARARADSGRYCMIDASLPLDAVQQQIACELDKFLAKHFLAKHKGDAQ
jgi:dTMP kinase